MNSLTPFRSPFEALRTMLPFNRDLLGDDANSLWSRLLVGNGNDNPSWTPRFEVIEKPEGFVFKTELPGMQADDIDVTLTGDVLTIKGEKKSEEVREEDHYRMSERIYGAFERSVTVPSPIDQESLDAEMKDGVLRVSVNKTTESRPAKVKVKNG